MFLDDQLYEWVKLREIEKAEDFETMVNELYDICECWYKPRLSPNMTYKEGRQLMDKTFKFWDLFIDKLKKEDYYLVSILKNASYKNAYLSNSRMKEIYDKGK